MIVIFISQGIRDEANNKTKALTSNRLNELNRSLIKSTNFFNVTIKPSIKYFNEDRNDRVIPPASFHRYMKVVGSISMHCFLVEIFTLIIFCLWSISLIMTSRAEITKSTKMHFFEQKCIIYQFEDDQSVRHHLN